MFYIKKFPSSPWKITIPGKIPRWPRSTNNSLSLGGISEHERKATMFPLLVSQEGKEHFPAEPSPSYRGYCCNQEEKEGWICFSALISWPYSRNVSLPIRCFCFMYEHSLKDFPVDGFVISPLILYVLCCLTWAWGKVLSTNEYSWPSPGLVPQLVS